MTITIEETVKKIAEIAEANQASQAKRVVHLKPMKIGTCYRQGDLNIFKVADNHSVGEVVERRQLADGESIGQRHVLLGEFKIYKGIKEPQIEISDSRAKDFVLGYAFDILGPCRNNHPEHSDFVFGEGCEGRYQVWHQLNTETRRRMED